MRGQNLFAYGIDNHGIKIRAAWRTVLVVNNLKIF